MRETLVLGDLPLTVLTQTVTGMAPSEVTATSYLYAGFSNGTVEFSQTSACTTTGSVDKNVTVQPL